MISNIVRHTARSMARTTTSRGVVSLPPQLVRTTSILPLRPFSTSIQSRASESDENLPPGMDKLMNNPEALSAISNLMKKMQENGIDLQSGQRPSMAQLAKLAVKEDVREATAKGEFLSNWSRMKREKESWTEEMDEEEGQISESKIFSFSFLSSSTLRWK